MAGALMLAFTGSPPKRCRRSQRCRHMLCFALATASCSFFAPDFVSLALRRIHPLSKLAQGAGNEYEAPPGKAQMREVGREAATTQQSSAQAEPNLLQQLGESIEDYVDYLDERFYLKLDVATRGTIVKVVCLVLVPLVVKAALVASGVEDYMAGSFVTFATCAGVAGWVFVILTSTLTKSSSSQQPPST
eukprot:TRINITY_DN4863_c2_g1_i1.p1 TRINITY_DN4863_c2_g1~~TRINITY_DN4863_c2_g1_i1.p1  ORF type:complete len:190 (-),score=17.39 TRINITY_DN4863_c2_g1_i1:49-618(-)